MDAAQSCKGKEKVHTMDSLSQDSVCTGNKRRREAVPEPTTSADVGEQQNPHAFWKIRDRKGWEHGIMIDGNRQHWKCKYCSMIGYSGGVSKLKHHLVGSGEVKKCPAVPEHVSTEIKHLMDAKREKRAKRAAQKGGSSVNSRGSSADDAKDRMVLLPSDSDALTGIDSHVLEEVANQTNVEHQRPAHEQAVATISESKDLIRLNTLVPSTSQGLVQLSRPDSTEVSDVHKDLTCNHCGKEARGDDSVLTCNTCMEICHTACLDAPLQSVVSDGSWYCESCTSTSKEPAEGSMVLVQDQTSCHHGNSIAIKDLEVCKPPDHEEPTSEEAVDNSRAIVVSGTQHTEVPEPPNTATLECCKMCGDPETEGKRFLICGNSLCPYKHYHIRCMSARQVATDAQSDRPCWYCPSCLCRACLSDRDDDLIVLCDGCDEAYHLYCLRPPRTSVPEGDWFCSSCSVERAKESSEYEQRMLKLHRKDGGHMLHLVDTMLSAAEELRAEEKLTK